MPEGVTHRELHDYLEREEQHTVAAMKSAVGEVKREVRWLIVLSVGLNQFFNTVDLSQIAKAGVAGSLVLAWVIKALGLLSLGR